MAKKAKPAPVAKKAATQSAKIATKLASKPAAKAKPAKAVKSTSVKASTKAPAKSAKPVAGKPAPASASVKGPAAKKGKAEASSAGKAKAVAAPASGKGKVAPTAPVSPVGSAKKMEKTTAAKASKVAPLEEVAVKPVKVETKEAPAKKGCGAGSPVPTAMEKAPVVEEPVGSEAGVEEEGEATGGEKGAEKKAKKRDELKIDRTGNLEQQWKNLFERSKGLKAVPYTMSENYEARTPLMHKVLGWGYVLTSQNNRLEVLFKDGIKILITNYKAS